jgi:hypothetical protein
MSKTNEQILQEKIAQLEAQLASKERAHKGVPVKWTNKAGKVIEGNAVEYMCITIKGVTHLKRKDEVTFL